MMHSLQKELQMTVNPLKLHYLMASRLMLTLGRLLLIKLLVELGMLVFCDTTQIIFRLSIRGWEIYNFFVIYLKSSQSILYTINGRKSVGF